MKSLLSNDKIRLLITSMCNLSCDYCHNEGQEKENAFMSVSFVEWLANVLAFSNTRAKSITISGGEPLLHPELLNIIRICHTFSDQVAIVTNGVLATDNILQRLASEGVSIFRIGVDSLNPRKPRPINGKLSENFDLIHIVNLAKSVGMRVELNCVISKFNIDEIGVIGKFAFDNGISVKFFEEVTVKTFGNNQISGKLQAEPIIPFNVFANNLSLGINKTLSFSLCKFVGNVPDLQTGNLEAIPGDVESNIYDDVKNNQITFQYCRYLCQSNSCWVTGSRIDPAGYVYNCMANRGLDQLKTTQSFCKAVEILTRSTSRICRSR